MVNDNHRHPHSQDPCPKCHFGPCKEVSSLKERMAEAAGYNTGTSCKASGGMPRSDGNCFSCGKDGSDCTPVSKGE